MSAHLEVIVLREQRQKGHVECSVKTATYSGEPSIKETVHVLFSRLNVKKEYAKWRHFDIRDKFEKMEKESPCYLRTVVRCMINGKIQAKLEIFSKVLQKPKHRTFFFSLIEAKHIWENEWNSNFTYQERKSLRKFT